MKLDAADTRLPRNKSEGDIPHIAITTGGYDSLECFLRKIGIEDSEITNPGDAGRVHLYTGNGSTLPNGSDAKTLWDTEAEWKKYDIVILSCEGDERNETKSDTARENLRKYLDAGGRVFASHFHYTWYKRLQNTVDGNPLSVTANWVQNSDTDPSEMNITIDQSFAKGKDFASWMDTVGGTTMPGSGQVDMKELKRNVTSVPATGQAPEMSRRWLYATQQFDDTKFFSFNTPLGQPPDKQCGRAVYTDIHVSSGDDSDGTFPDNCTTKGLTPQEKALVFLLMDLSACIQDDSKPPVPPPPDPGVK